MGIKLDDLANILSFPNVEKCKEFIIKAGGKLEKEKLDCKTSRPFFLKSEILTKAIGQIQ